MKYEMLIWDWKEDVDVAELDKAIAKFKRPCVRSVPDTGGDSVALVVTERNDPRPAQMLWDLEMEEISNA
jgi:hypothetical protein